jgi:hypothetical protein
LSSIPLSSAIAAADGGLDGGATVVLTTPGPFETETGLSSTPQNSQNTDPSGRALPQAEQFMATASIPHVIKFIWLRKNSDKHRDLTMSLGGTDP